MSNFKTECRKFQPNIFSKVKCSHCFRQREEHSAEALDSNRACRKVSKCGYLFVAPDWDFSNPLNRTKRWQRRWFVLYDDGELTYSVDDLPATIPQGVIDMNRVLEVSEAEDVTGNQFSLAITSPDRATFVKGTCREESRWWRDVLSVFPRSHKQSGRYKRNATFPGIKSSSVLQQGRAALGRTSSPSLAAQTFDQSAAQRAFFHSCSSESFNVGRPSSAPTLGGQDDVFPSKETSPLLEMEKKTSPPPSPLYHSTPLSSLPPSTRLLSDEHKENTPPYIEDYEDNPPTSESPPTQDKVLLGGHRPRTRRTAKREARGLVQPRSDLSHQLYLSEFECSKREEKLKDIADSLTRPRSNSTIPYLSKENGVKPTRESDALQEHRLKRSEFEDITDVTDSSLTGQIRGDPDGCGLDGDSNRFPSLPDTQRVDLPAEDILYIKKGWLLKQSYSQEWNKHWFVLEGSGLKFYRDPAAEDNGILDGVIDMGMVKDVQEKEVGRNYGFIVALWDEKKYTFSAVTSGIRTNWIQAMRNAANLKEPKDRPLTLGEKLEREMRTSKEKSSSFSPPAEVERDATHLSSSLTALGRHHMSSEDDFKTASDSSFFKDVSSDDLVTYDRLTSRSTSRVGSSSHRSRSSPPSSRRGTRDDFPLNSSSCGSSRLSEGHSIPSMQDLDAHLTPEKDSNGTINSTGEGMLVDLLETQVESLKAKLEQTQENYLELHKENLALKDRLSTKTTTSHRTSYKKYSLPSSDSGDRFFRDFYLEQSQITELKSQIAKQEEEIREKNKMIAKIESIRKQFQDERREWEERIASEESKVKELRSSESTHADIVRRLTRSLQDTETKVNSLSKELQKAKGVRRSSLISSELTTSGVRSENLELKRQVSDRTTEIARLKESLKSEKSEVYKWKDLVKELRSLLDGRNVDMEMKREEVVSLREKLKETQSELDTTVDRLHRGIEENESLCGRLRELERQSILQQPKVRRESSSLSISNSKKNLPRMDSLSDLTNLDLNFDPEQLEKESLVDEFKDLRMRFEKAVGEIRALKREVRNMEATQDDIELTNQRLMNELKVQEKDFEAQNHLMGTRVEDLTTKLSNAEKQVRTLKQKLTRTESKERRRTLSLKGKESFSLSKDLETKLSELEATVITLMNGTDVEQDSSFSSLHEGRRSKSIEDATKRTTRLRRKSLDGGTAEDAIKAVLRVNVLEEKVSSLSGRELKKLSSTTSVSSCGTTQGVGDNSVSSSFSSTVPKSKSPAMSPLRSPASSRKVSSSKSPKSCLDKTPRLTRSDSEPKILKERIKSLEKVLTTVEAKLSECLTCARSMECACVCGDETLSRLLELLVTTARVVQCRQSQYDQTIVRRVRPLVLKIQDLLKEKSITLVQKRHQLRTSGKWTRDAQFKCLAERLAFETTLLSQIAQVLQATRDPKSFEASFRLQELIEAHRKVTFLEKKLSNSEFDMDPMTPLDFYTSLLAEKLVVEGDLLGAMSPSVNQKGRASAVVTETCKELTQKVLDRERSLAELVTKYKEEKLSEIAVVMARETVTGTQPPHDDSVLLEEFRLREAWGMAQDLLTQEIANLETSQSVLRLSHVLGSTGEDFSFASRLSVSTLDRLQMGAEESLRQEMEESVFTLSAKYEEVLASYRAGDTSVISAVAADIDTVLGEFAAVIAQKALVDGHLAAAAVTDDEIAATSESLSIVEEKPDPMEAAGDVVASESHLLMFLGGHNDPSTEGLISSALSQAEFSFIYNKVASSSASEGANLAGIFVRDQTGSQKSLTSSASDRDIDTDGTYLTTASGGPKIPPSPKSRKRLDAALKSRRVSDITGMVTNCRQCEELRQDLSRLKRSVDIKRLKRQEAECKKCVDYLQTLKHLEEEHRDAIEALQRQHQAEIDRLRDQVKYDPPTRDSDDELTELKRRLCLLEEGYESQIAALKKQYQEALGSQSDVCEENIRQRYQREIEHLRELCEKGLTAMETSHRRLVAEMEAKHRREMEQLQAEKEEALAEETQATLAALDAMRKAHEAEVQKEVAKFKEEFLRRAENGREGEAAHSRLHEEQLREVRREILALSEKYSGKCLEIAAKEQKAESLQRQLMEAKAQARTLEERNRVLKQRTSFHLSQLQATSDKTPSEVRRQYECELALKDEEIAWLNQMLQKSKMHESDLGSLCGQLGHFLRTEKSIGTDNASEIRTRLQSQIISAVRWKGDDGGDERRFFRCEERSKNLGKSGREVSRSPSCPSGLSRFSASLWDGPPGESSRAPSSLMGMVAQRKKVFEGPLTGKAEC